MSKDTFTRKQVENIIDWVYDYYGIDKLDKFREENLSMCSDWPSSWQIQDAIMKDITSFIDTYTF